MRVIISMLVILLLSSCQGKEEQTVFDDIFEEGSDLFKEVILDKDKYEIQILFSPIDIIGDSIVIEDHFFNYRPGEYFYPASSVKMPVAFLALQKLEELRRQGIDIDRNTPLQIDSVRSPQSPVLSDTTNNGGMATIAHYIDKIFAVSDNDAYNRLFEFCGSDYINTSLRSKGIFTNSRIVHRVGVRGFSYDENRHTPPIRFLGEDGRVIHKQPKAIAQGNHLTIVSNTDKGVAYIDDNGEKIEEPFDFSEKNFINIRDLQESLKRLVLAEMYYNGERYKISKEDITFLMESMAKRPKDHPYLDEQLDQYYDGYVKFFLFGDSKEPIPDHIEIRNKVGFAYGYLTDCAFIRDTKENIQYFLTATIHVNENQTYNDGIYEYDEIGIPFLAELGRLVHQYMLK